MRKFKSLLKYTYFSIAFALLFMIPVHAYIDPSVMTYAIQVVAGSAIAIGTVVGLYWRKITKGLRKLFRVKKTKHTDNESDDIFMMSSKDKKTIRYTDIKQREIKESKGKFLSVNKDKTNPKNDSEEKENVGHKVWCVIRDLLPSILLSCALTFMLFAYAPLEIYMNNKLDFWYNLSLLEPQITEMCKWSVLICIVFYLTCYLVNKKFYHFVLLAGFASFVILYIHGNFYVGDLPSLDGGDINWVSYTEQIQTSILISLITIGVIALITRFIKIIKMGYFIDFVCITISIMLVVSLNDISKKTTSDLESQGTYQVTTINEFNYSEDENFIIFLVDAFDAETFSNLLEWYPEYREVFKDFTYYPDTVCAYTYTSRSIPYILSGQWYENQEDFVTFESNAMNESPLFASLQERGYRLDVYDAEFLYDVDVSKYSNVIESEVEVSDDQLFRKEEMQLAMYKYAPYFLKSNYEMNLDEFNETQQLVEEDEEETPELFTWSDTDFYQKTQEEEITKTHEKVFKFIHLEGAHIGFDLDENCERIEGGTYEQKQRGVITMINAYLTKLKEAGTYDNSRIIIMADHGYNPDLADGREYEDVNSRGNALFMVKSIGEDHEFQVNDSSISYENLQDMYQNLLNGADGNTCFDGLLDNNGRRRLLSYVYTDDSIITEYYQTGYATDMDTMVPTGNVYEYHAETEPEGEEEPIENTEE